MITNTAALQRLKQQRSIIDVRIQKAEAKQKTAERRQDAKRKILIGAYYMDLAQRENKYDQLIKRLDAYLTRSSDRKLFNLSELKAQH